MDDEKVPNTHIGYALKREGRRTGRWLEVGTARIEGPDKPAHIHIDRTPTGGFNGYVYFSPIGVKPPDPQPQPERPFGDE